MPQVSGGSGVSSSSQIVNDIILNDDINAAAGIQHSKMESDARARANHSGTQLAATISDLATEVLARSKHTGTQLAATISDFAAAVAAAGTGFTIVTKSADETRQSNTTNTADTHLQFSMAANTSYVIRLLIGFDSSATADFKFELAGPAAPTALAGVCRAAVENAASSDAFTDNYANCALSLTSTSTFVGFIEIALHVKNGGNAGTFSFNWSQVTSNASNTTVKKGSILEYKAT